MAMAKKINGNDGTRAKMKKAVATTPRRKIKITGTGTATPVTRPKPSKPTGEIKGGGAFGNSLKYIPPKKGK
jgi:hypothetical protein